MFRAAAEPRNAEERHRSDRPACAVVNESRTKKKKGIQRKTPENLQIASFPPLFILDRIDRSILSTNFQVMSASPQPQIQVLQGAGSTVGSTAGAPTRVKDAGNSNLGTFGVSCIMASCKKITELYWLTASMWL